MVTKESDSTNRHTKNYNAINGLRRNTSHNINASLKLQNEQQRVIVSGDNDANDDIYKTTAYPGLWARVDERESKQQKQTSSTFSNISMTNLEKIETNIGKKNSKSPDFENYMMVFLKSTKVGNFSTIRK